MRRVRGTSTDRRRAAAALEFALIAPLFVALLVGAVSIHRMVSTTAVMVQACSRGSRLVAADSTGAAVGGLTPNQKVTRDVKNYMAAAGIDVSTATVAITHADGPRAGQTFEIGAPENAFQLVRIEARKPVPPTDPLAAYLTQGRGLRAWVVLRAGRVTSP